MNDTFFKPSLNVESFIGENSSVDTERFLLFMKAYYEWMQSTTLSEYPSCFIALRRKGIEIPTTFV